MPFDVKETALPGVIELTPKSFGDDRGFFFESYNRRDFAKATGLDLDFVQDNHSRSVKGVLRGIHFQIEHPQGKLVRVTSGEIFDVAVDLRRGSPHFGRWVGCHLSASAKNQLWVPPGFGHAFLCLSETAEVLYKTTDYWYREHDRSLIWNDPDVGIVWPYAGSPLLAEKDAKAPALKNSETYA